MGEKCFATGWGATRGVGSDDVLKQAEHPIQNGQRCKNPFIEFDNKSMICAGRMDRFHGLCHGDSGGPLVCQKAKKWHVYGVASYVIDSNFIDGICGFEDRPTVFNKVSNKVDWIKLVMSRNS